MQRMRVFGAAVWVLSLAAAAAGTPAAPASPAALDPEAVARRMVEAMGGPEAFDRLRTLRFAFVVEREGKEAGRIGHIWDRHDGRYRVEGVDGEGRPWIALFNAHEGVGGPEGGNPRGRAWLDGMPLAGEELREALERGWGRFINDTYWLLMPAKLLDPGVRLAGEGTKPDGDRMHDVIRVTFDDGIGLTPGDTYWAWIDTESGLMTRWDFSLQGWEEGRAPATFRWTDWRAVGGVRLSAVKTSADGTTVIRFEGLSGSAGPDDAAFAGP